LISEKKLGATLLENGDCCFRVWGPSVDKLEVHIVSPENRIEPLAKDSRGYYSAEKTSIQPGTRYYYRLNGEMDYPDPASRYQPEGVHGPSQVVSPGFPWEDISWSGLPLKDYVIYELHVGSFTTEGNFQTIIPHLDELKNLGITAVELMPVAQFPGEYNWGYDGVFPFAVQNSYGGPDGLKELVNTCHKKELVVILDVVYNHLGPEGNCFEKYGPYFTNRYKTPWGKAMNFDGSFSDEVRRFFIDNAAYWITEFHIDALRLDALHAILDVSARPFLSELSTMVKKIREKTNKHVYLIGESDANDRRVILPAEENGLGLNAQWSDDFHHALHNILTGERDGYYRDFGQIAHLAKAYREGFVYSGQDSEYRKRKHGSSSKDIPAERFVVFIQNHDQVGNRMLGERLTQLVSFEKLKLAAGMVILSPYIPLIFMGQEYGEPAPFQYFVNHSDPALIEAVRQGRQQEFAVFHRNGTVPNPQDRNTYLCTKLNHNLKEKGQHRLLWELYRELLQLRREIPALVYLSKDNLEVIGYEKSRVLYICRWYGKSQSFMVVNFDNKKTCLTFPVPSGTWNKKFDSKDKKWFGRGGVASRRIVSRGEITLTLGPESCVLYLNVLKEA
jgi:maltooligosyltrehalose trehalohydrolase